MDYRDLASHADFLFYFFFSPSLIIYQGTCSEALFALEQPGSTETCFACHLGSV